MLGHTDGDIVGPLLGTADAVNDGALVGVRVGTQDGDDEGDSVIFVQFPGWPSPM